MSKHHYHHQKSARNAREHSTTDGGQHNSSNGDSLQQEFSQEAFNIDLDEGRPEAHALEHWLTAKAVVQGRHTSA